MLQAAKLVQVVMNSHNICTVAAGRTLLTMCTYVITM